MSIYKSSGISIVNTFLIHFVDSDFGQTCDLDKQVYSVQYFC